jgi:hypothetical protein
MPGKATGLSLLLGGKLFGKEAKPKEKKRTGTSRNDLKVAMRDFRNAKDDDSAVDALLNFSELSRDYQRD